MKKNLISIMILALLVVNIVLTSLLMFNIVGTNKKTAALVTDIAAAVSLDLGTPAEEEEKEVVPMKNVEPYTIADMTIPLTKDEDGKDHFMVLSVTLSMNTKNKGYKTFGADLSTKENLIKGEINDVVGRYTLSEARDNEDALKKDILESIQKLFDSDFIFEVTFSSTMYQ